MQTCRILAASMESRDRDRIKIDRVVRKMGEEPEKRQGNHEGRNKNVLEVGERRDNGRENLPSWGSRGRSKTVVGWK